MDIIKRDGFYYLRNSFRKAGKVAHRERYIGKSIPENMALIQEDFLRKCMAESLFIILGKIKKQFSKEWNSYPESIKRKYWIEASINFTYNTNAIEGSKVTKEETEDIISRKISPNKRPIEDVIETKKHSEAFFEVIKDKGKLNLSKLLDWHRMVFEETKPDIAGRIRTYSVKVGNYRAIDWQDIPKLLDDFFRWLCINEKIMHPIELAARAHYRFEKIHPFGDGNGRIGRLIIMHILCKLSYPLAVLTYKNRKSYYHFLEKNENEFLNYFIQRYIKEHSLFLKD